MQAIRNVLLVFQVVSGISCSLLSLFPEDQEKFAEFRESVGETMVRVVWFMLCLCGSWCVCVVHGVSVWFMLCLCGS